MNSWRIGRWLIGFIAIGIITFFFINLAGPQEIGNPLDTLKNDAIDNQWKSLKSQKLPAKPFQAPIKSPGKQYFRKTKMSGLKRLSHKKSDKYGRTINYHGYSKNFIKIKQLLCQGKAEKVGKIYDQEDEKISEKCNTEMELAHKIGFLGLLERGILAVNRGDPKDAEQKFFFAEQVLNNRTKESKFAEGFIKGFIFVAETLTGVEELNPYKGEPYEDILMLNYKSIAYLLQGDRRAYNVTRRAIDWQNMAKKEFEKKVREAK